MHGLKTLAIALAATGLIGIAPTESYSQDELAALDPSAQAADMCGQGRSASMRSMPRAATKPRSAPPTTRGSSASVTIRTTSTSS